MPPAPSGRKKLRGDPEFRRVLQAGAPTAGTLLAAHMVPLQAETRVGFIAGRGVGGAVVRNRARRLMREAWRRVEPNVPAGVHVVFVARPAIRTATADDVVAEMAAVLRGGIGIRR